MRLKEIENLLARDYEIRKFAGEGNTTKAIAGRTGLTIKTVEKVRSALKAVEEGKPDPRAYAKPLPWKQVSEMFFCRHVRPDEWRGVAYSLGLEYTEAIDAIFKDLDPAYAVREGGRMIPPGRPWATDDDPRQAVYEKHFWAVHAAWNQGNDIDHEGIAQLIGIDAPLVEDMLVEILYEKYDEIPGLLAQGYDKWQIGDLLHLSSLAVDDYILPPYHGNVRGLYLYGSEVPGSKGNWLPRRAPRPPITRF